jgi:hypothetical protein
MRGGYLSYKAVRQRLPVDPHLYVYGLRSEATAREHNIDTSGEANRSGKFVEAVQSRAACLYTVQVGA